MAASRIIIFNPDETKYLVGKESYFISNIKDISVDMQFFMDTLFSRKIQKIKSPNDKDEINYYTKKISILLKNNAIMKIIKTHSDSTRITFGDIRYKIIDSHIYSYTLPQYLPRDIKYSFPGGQPSNANTDTSCALRELYEETGIDLRDKPYDIRKLIDTGKINRSYKLFYYILNNIEYKRALQDIQAKNKSGKAELHDLQFIDKTALLSRRAYMNFKKMHK